MIIDATIPLSTIVEIRDHRRDAIIGRCLPCKDVEKEEPEDPVIRARRFKMGDNLNLDDLDLDDFVKSSIPSEEENKDPEIDEALGDLFDPFASPKSSDPGTISLDGSVLSAPEGDVISSMAQEGERRVNWAMMVAMIFVFSALSFVAGTAFPPIISIILLIALATIGFTFGERWVPNQELHLLGVTWVIISMKVLYGLAVELNHWELGSFLPISVELLGIVLLLLVALNVFVSYRYNHDAIAAQATLVLLSIGSTAGSVGGEIGVAIMILVATLLLHGLAWHRNSGNLAALGIAASNLWIGMHALTDGFTAGSLVIEPLDTPLILFVLLLVITAINAVMAAKFAREENWFSTGFDAVGLGKPGLWGVSISMGMVGALLTVASGREDIGYALGMVTFLGASFGGSYLVVRGVEAKRVILPLSIGGGVLTTILSLGFSMEPILQFDSYETFTILASILTGFVMLRDQHRVTDRVLWVGAIAVLILLVVLIPVESTENGGDGGVVLLVLLSILHIGTASLALLRKAPSLAGVTVLLPWTWIVIEELIEETIRTILIANDILDPGSIIEFSAEPLAVYLGISAILMMVVNLKMGEKGINLASGFLGITEISASIRDSGALQLWSMGLWIPLVTILVMSQLGGFTGPTLLALTSLLFALHIVVEFLGRRVGSPVTMLATMALSASILSWRHGFNELWMIITAFSVFSVLARTDTSKEATYTNGIALVSLPILVSISSKQPVIILQEADSVPNFDISMIAIICAGLVLSIYLPKAEKMEKLLKPAAASLWLLILSIGLSLQEEVVSATYLGIGFFVISSIWLVARGEIRAEIKSMTIRDARVDLARKSKTQAATLGTGQISSYDTRIAEMQATRKKKRELKETENIEELYTTDVSHNPRIVTMILMIVLFTGIVNGFLFGPSPAVIFLIGAFSIILISIARQRTRSMSLELPTILGIELPIAISIGGMLGILLAGHLNPGSSNRELFDLLVVIILILIFCIISIWKNKNLLDRIPIASDWFVLPLSLGLIMGAIMVESLPAPFTIDPLDGELLEWSIPLLVLESILILFVGIDLWIGSKRDNAGRETQHSSSGRGFRVLSYAILSWGPAAITAVLNAVYQGYKKKQSEAVGISILVAPIALISLSNLIPEIRDFIPEFCYLLGLVMIIVIGSSIPSKNGHWTMMAVIDSHILIIIAIITIGEPMLIPVSFFVLSTIIWIVGILQLRKILRIIGLIDLILGAGLTLLIFGSSSDLGGIGLFALLAVIGIELALITWLSQRNENALLKD